MTTTARRATSSRRSAPSPTIAAGCVACARRSRRGLTAEAAVERVQNDARAKMQRQTDPYLRERLHDLDDLANRLLHQLVGRSFVADHATLPDNAIIVARSMGPAALLDYDRSKTPRPGARRRRRAEPCGDRRALAGHPGGRQRRQHHQPRRAGRQRHRRRHVRRRLRAPDADVENSYGEKARLRAGARSNIARCATCPARRRTGSRSTCT